MELKRAFRNGGQIFALVVLGAVVLGGVAVAQDTLEPNDDFDTATNVSSGQYPNLTIQGGESDFFAVDLEAGANLTATIVFSGADLDMAVYGPDEIAIETGTSATDNESVTVTANESGIHYVEVYGFAGQSGEYSLDISASNMPREDNESDDTDNQSNDTDNQSNDNESDGSGPGFGFVSALAGLGGAGYLLRRLGSGRRE